jgi:ribonuclease HII
VLKQLQMLLSNFSSFDCEAGADEAGRGCLAGPVTAAVVLLPTHFENLLLDDSKKLSEKTRNSLRPVIESEAICYAVTHIQPLEIDEINILNASMKAMQECILKLSVIPNFIIVDGNRALNAKLEVKNTVGKQLTQTEIGILKSLPNQCIIKGDSKFLSIAAASVLAKTYRDEYMNSLHKEFPMYNWKQNKGYPTEEHREAIIKYGLTKYHRLSFRSTPKQLKLNL